MLGLEESGGGEGQGAADQQVSNRGQRRGGEASERQRNQAPIEPSGNRARLEPSKRDASRQAHPSVLGFTDRQSSRDSGGIAISWPRIPPASCSNHGRDVARPLSRRDHRAPACGGSAMSPANGRLRSRAWAFQMGRSQMTESGSTATPQKKTKTIPNSQTSTLNYSKLFETTHCGDANFQT